MNVSTAGRNPRLHGFGKFKLKDRGNVARGDDVPQT
jgi:hypothetical protein